MALYFPILKRNYAVKKIANRDKAIDNLLLNYPRKRNIKAFKLLNTQIKAQRDEDFKHYSNVQFITFKANLKYVQVNSGLSQGEFSAIANISRNALSEVNQYPTTIPIHSFLKCYSIMRYYIQTIEFCDMFLIDFSEAFPYLKANYSANRIALGKSPTGYKTKKQAA